VGFCLLWLSVLEIYRKFVSGVLETERTTVNISDDKKKIATAETLTIDQGSLTVNPVAVIRYQYDNHLGSASLELDESADIISYEEYHPFGTTSYRSGRTETETSLKRYKYVGKERDEETGLYYYGFRYYAAWLYRFVSVDPLQFEYPHYTPFQYAGNKPISYIDLDGLEEYKLNDVYIKPTVKIDNTYYNKTQPKKIIAGTNYSRVGQGTLGVLNIISGLSLVVAGATIAATTGISVVGALGGISMMLAGFSQMAIGVAQTTDALASKEKHIPDVSGPTELIGAKLTEKTGNPYYQAGGAVIDLASSVGFGATKIKPVITNLKTIKQIGLPQDLKETIEFTRNTIDIGNDVNTAISNGNNILEFHTEIPNEGMSVNNDIMIFINQNEQSHTIYPGETLTSIANDYNTTVEEIIKLNSIEDPNLIYAGEEIKVFESRTVDIINLNSK
jgi:RHS repeat-associated protein